MQTATSGGLHLPVPPLSPRTLPLAWDHSSSPTSPTLWGCHLQAATSRETSLPPGRPTRACPPDCGHLLAPTRILMHLHPPPQASPSHASPHRGDDHSLRTHPPPLHPRPPSRGPPSGVRTFGYRDPALFPAEALPQQVITLLPATRGHTPVPLAPPLPRACRCLSPLASRRALLL